MANLKEIRVRIASVTSTRQITSAMKMVSAAKLRRAQDSIIQMRPYANKLNEILKSLSESIGINQDNIYATKRDVKKVLIIVITSNRGLCGAFNSNVIKRTVQLINEDYPDIQAKGNVDLITIGKKGTDFFRSKKFKVVEAHNELFDKVNYDSAAQFIDSVMKKFVNAEYDRVEFVYNQFKNAGVQVLTREQFLPIAIKEEREFFELSVDYIFEPSREHIIEGLIPQSLKLQFYKALLDSYTSEHGARMTAMHKATDNATEMLKSLNLTYNKARQSSITNEILEIVSGAEALKG
jgi:F-type H+-transporting ATPase subunit gamma